MPILTDQKHVEIHRDALVEFDRTEGACHDERQLSLEDRRFYSISGAQWEGQYGDQFENKPKIEVNLIHLSVIRIINQWRNNTISVTFVTKTGESGDQLADVCTGMYRAGERESQAREAYQNAFEEAVGGGVGAWRLRNVAEDEGDPDNDRQVIRIEPIFDADICVYFDLNARLQDKSDAKSCYVLTAMDSEAFKQEYDEDPNSWPKPEDDYDYTFNWCNADLVYVAEFYQVEEKSQTIVIFEDDTGEEKRHGESDLDEDLMDSLMVGGFQEVRRKRIKVKRVHKYLMSGGGVLEDLGIIAGNTIPIVPVYGKRWVVNGIERFMGHVRLAKDAQRLKNSMLSWLTEIASVSPVEKPIFTPEQMAGHQNMWANDNIKNYPYLLVNPMTDANGQIAAVGPLGYTHPPNIPPALVGLLQQAGVDMQELLGNHQGGEQIVSNISGKAIELIQQRLDGQAFIYVDNMAQAAQRSGEIWQGMAAEIYTEPGRKIKMIGTGGKAEPVTLMQQVVNEDGLIVIENDLSKARFDVHAEAGPSSDSKRAAIVKELTGVLQYATDPETQMALFTALLANLEGEGLGDLRDWARRRGVASGVIKPTKEEEKELEEAAANQQPDPNTQFLQASAMEAEAKAKKTEADTVHTVAKIEQTKADTLKTMAEIEQGDKKLALDALGKMSGGTGR